MSEFTPILNLEKPNFNTITWHDQVNGNFDILDAAYGAIGTGTALPIYLAADYGMFPGVADCKAFFSTAVADVSGNGGGILLFGPGTYTFDGEGDGATSQTAVPANVHIYGCGMDVTFFEFIDSFGGFISWFHEGNVVWQDLTIDAGATILSQSALQFGAQTFDCAARRVKIVNMGAFGITIGQGGFDTKRWTISDCVISRADNTYIDNSAGIAVYPTEAKEGLITRNHIINTQVYLGGSFIMFSHNKVTGSSVGGAVGANATTDTHDISIIGNTIDGTRLGYDIFTVIPSGMELWGARFRIIGNTVRNCAGTGMGIICENSIIANNLVYNNGLFIPTAGIVLHSHPTLPTSANNCIVAGNRCFGADQTYGYSEGVYPLAVPLVGVKLIGNNFGGNSLGDYDVANISADTEWLAELPFGVTEFTDTEMGYAPASGGGTSNFLRADGTWAAPGAAAARAVREVNAAGAVTFDASTDDIVFVNKTVGAATVVNLPAASTRTQGREVTIIDAKLDAATNAITVTPNGAETISGLSTWVLNTQGGFVNLMPHPDNTGWCLC